MSSNDNGIYTTTAVAAATVSFKAVSSVTATNIVTADIDSDGKLGTWVYAGEFK